MKYIPGPKPLEVKLTDIERHGLEKLVNRHNTSQQKALRGRMILLADSGKSNREIARELEVCVDTVRLWRQRWYDLQPITLEDLSIEDRCQIIELACEKPADSGLPISQWTRREIADEIKNRGITDMISPRHAFRLVKKGVSNCKRHAHG